MAGNHGATARAVELESELQQDPYNFDFFQALRRLECVNPDRPRLGRSVRAVDDPVRLGQEPSMAFAPSSLVSYRAGKEGRPGRLTVHLFGLLGPNGPLPLHLTEYARDRLRNAGDPTFASFLDIFHHRMLSLFYRAWASSQPTVNFDRPDDDRFALYIGSLFGLGMPSVRGRDEFSDTAKLHYAGHLACQTRHADGLRSILEGYFGEPSRIEQFVGQWLTLPDDDICLLGLSREKSTLGRTMTIGARAWECQTKFRVVLGPLSRSSYESFLPGQESLRRLAALVRSYVGDELAWDLNLVLNGDEVPPLTLGGDERLGWTTWLAGRSLEKDAGDLRLTPLGCA